MEPIEIGYRTTYGFKLLIGTSKEIFIDSERKPYFIFHVAGKSININNLEGKLLVHGTGFSTFAEAKEHHQNLKNAIYLCGLKAGFGFNIIEESLGPGGLILSGESEIKFGFPVKDILDEIGNNFLEILSFKQSLALELYNLSFFETSLRASFITLITSIECLIERPFRPPEVITILGNLKKIVEKSDIKNEDKDFLIKSLNGLRSESFRRMCRKFIKNLFGKDAEKQFQKFYGIRNDLVHKGKWENGDLDLEFKALRKLVQELLLKDIGPTK